MTATCATCAASWTGAKLEHCPACHHTFTNTRAGDKHRVGEHHVYYGPNRRRCLSMWEMEAAGMARNHLGHWMAAAREPENDAASVPRNDEQGEGGGLVQPGSVRPSTQYGSEVE